MFHCITLLRKLLPTENVNQLHMIIFYNICMKNELCILFLLYKLLEYRKNCSVIFRDCCIWRNEISTDLVGFDKDCVVKVSYCKGPLSLLILLNVLENIELRSLPNDQ